MGCHPIDRRVFALLVCILKQMEALIKISNSKSQLNLRAKMYTIDIVGGWLIRMGDFRISAKNISTSETFHARSARWPVQSYYNKKRVRRILKLDIPKEGRYDIQFLNEKTIGVKKSNLFFLSYLQNWIPHESIGVLIREQ